jgi:hypothetical protein
MDNIGIPIATNQGKFAVSGYCFLILIAIVYWRVPRFKMFLIAALVHSENRPRLKPWHRILGFVIYALVFLPAAIAAYTGLSIASSAPTVISSEGVSGGQWACSGYVLAPLCTFPLNSWANSRK